VLPWNPLKPEWPRPWLVRTIESPNAEPAKFVESAREFLSVATDNLSPSRNNRAAPLLALPVVGAGRGGGASQAGQIVRVLLPLLYEFTAKHEVDVAVVMRDAAQYAAAQAVRTEQKGELAWLQLDDSLRSQCDALAERANREEMVLFLGAGVSRAAGLPTWDELLQQLAGDTASDQAFRELNVLDRARLLQRSKYPADKLGLEVAARLDAAHYSLAHGLLAALPTREIVTTNFDCLFEMASNAAGDRVDVLPGTETPGQRRWLLKLHGCVTKPESIVLTREDYLRYDIERAALAGLVQGLLLTRHMLFVGFSLTDDNFHRIIDVVKRAIGSRRLGTCLSVAGNPLLRDVLADDLDWVEFGKLPKSARVLEIFLDRLAAKTVASGHHLFDRRYEDTLSPAERGLRDELTSLRHFVSSVPKGERTGAAWAAVSKMLQQLGFDPVAKQQSD
jgi:hypothetical protein